MDREGFFDHFDEAGVDFSLGAILDDEALALAGAPHLRFDRQDNGVELRAEIKQTVWKVASIGFPCGLRRPRI